MLRKPVEAVLFDMDGLLIDTEAVYIDAYHAAARTLGVAMPQALCHAMIGIPTRECQAMIQDHFGPAFSVEDFHVRFNATAARLLDAHVPVKPGAAELLAWLDGRGLPLAIATSSRAATAERHLGKAGLRRHFRTIATRYDVERAKPHPDVYLEAARRLGVDPARCIAFEDSNVGLTAAHAAGTMAIMVPDIVPPTPEVRAKALHVADDLHAALKMLQEHL
jgi:HAD superfamily hydrolase (TIGR01509 family)